MITTQSADGVLHQFPDGTDGAVIDRAMADYVAQSAPPAAPSGPTFDTAADSTARGLPPLSSQNIRHTGWAGNVRDAISGASAPGPMQVPTPAELATQWGSVGKGAAVGAAGSAVGMPGDIESLGRTGLSFMGAPVSRDSFLPTTRGVENFIAGPSKSPEESMGRFGGEFLGPYFAKQAITLAGKGGGWLASQGLGLTTGVGDKAVRGAYEAGRDGGQVADAFQSQLRGNAPAADVVQNAKDAVSQLRSDRSAYYQANSAAFKNDPTVLNFAPIDKAITDAASVGMYKGKSLSGAADKVWSKIAETVQEWKQADPADFHTAAGLDALKQKIGNLAYEEDLKAIAGPGTPGSVMVDKVYNAIKKQITAQAPGYAKTMADYSEATDTIRELEKGFSLGDKATIDTALRKLQSVMRNNVSTNYGQRTAMGEILNDSGKGTLMPQLAGQALNSWTPRGLQRLLAGGEALASLHPAALPYTIPAIAASSPRLVGEGAYYAGKMSGAASRAIPQGIANNPTLILSLLQAARAAQPAMVP